MSHGELTCRQFVDFLSAYVDGELPAVARQVFEKHSTDCPPCLNYLDTFRKAIELVSECGRHEDALPPSEVPQRLIDAILAARRALPKDG